jgi:hypothetical protein
MKSAECRQRDRNELYGCGIINRKPTVERMLFGFGPRLINAREVLGDTPEVRAAHRQLQKVNACVESHVRTNGKTFYNLFQASAKLNDLLLDLETEVRYAGDCDVCGHGKHDAGLCAMCGCGQTEVVGGY